jgi:hypothetical protein
MEYSVTPFAQDAGNLKMNNGDLFKSSIDEGK